MEARKFLLTLFFYFEIFLKKIAIFNLDVEEGNVDVVVPVCPCMFMIEAQGVHDLVGHRSFVLYRHTRKYHPEIKMILLQEYK
jgi:hypothetical protein